MNHDLKCPGCGQIDGVQSVVAIHHTGVTHQTQSYNFDAPAVTSDGRPIVVFGAATSTSTSSSALARATAWAPELRDSRAPLLAAVLLLGLLVPVVQFALMINFGGGDRKPTLTSGLTVVAIVTSVVWAPMLIALCTGIGHRRHNRRVERGMPVAMTLWQDARYCHRCGGCFWHTDAVGAGVPLSELVAPALFRQILWTAAGFLAPRARSRRSSAPLPR